MIREVFAPPTNRQECLSYLAEIFEADSQAI